MQNKLFCLEEVSSLEINEVKKSKSEAVYFGQALFYLEVAKNGGKARNFRETFFHRITTMPPLCMQLPITFMPLENCRGGGTTFFAQGSKLLKQQILQSHPRHNNIPYHPYLESNAINDNFPHTVPMLYKHISCYAYQGVSKFEGFHCLIWIRYLAGLRKSSSLFLIGRFTLKVMPNKGK